MTSDLQETIDLFAYGTLRRGEALHDWVDENIVEDLGVATIPFARLHFSRQHRGYPYFVPSDKPTDVVTGEVYRLTLNPQTISMFQMEMNAGYAVRELFATLADGSEVPVAVCVWDYEFGDQVPNNDWRSAERVEFWR